MKLALAQIATAVSGGGTFDPRDEVVGYSIDSRTVQPGELFFAVSGERFDGHQFVDEAISNGAVAAVVRADTAQRFAGKPVLTVHDPLLALQELAAQVRRRWGKPLIGVTGSAGKTTTKDAIAHVLSSRFRVLKTEGNLNNHFGLPLMLLRLTEEHEMAVVEMGMSHAGEIAALGRIAQPNVGVVTCVAPVHLEFFDSVDGIARAKYELIEALPTDGTAILNADDERVKEFGKNFAGRVWLYGTAAAADVRAENVESMGSEGWRFDVAAGQRREPARLPVIGAHNVRNALAAIATALDRGVPLVEAAEALATFTPGEKRGQVIHLGGITVLNDCYNSNPKALDSMVDALLNVPAKRHIVVAGEMLELGPAGEELHRMCGSNMAARGVDFLLGVRGLALPMVDAARQAGMKAEFVSTPEETADWLMREAREGDAILLKASRGVKLESALEKWQSAFADQQQ